MKHGLGLIDPPESFLVLVSEHLSRGDDITSLAEVKKKAERGPISSRTEGDTDVKEELTLMLSIPELSKLSRDIDRCTSNTGFLNCNFRLLFCRAAATRQRILVFL